MLCICYHSLQLPGTLSFTLELAVPTYPILHTLLTSDANAVSLPLEKAVLARANCIALLLGTRGVVSIALSLMPCPLDLSIRRPR